MNPNFILKKDDTEEQLATSLIDTKKPYLMDHKYFKDLHLTSQAFIEQLSRGNNTISYSRDKSVTETTLSISINMARDLDLTGNNQSLNETDEELQHRAIDSFNLSAQERAFLRRRRKKGQVLNNEEESYNQDGDDEGSLDMGIEEKLRAHNFFENSALQYEHMQYPQSLESTFIGAHGSLKSSMLKHPELPKQLFAAPSFFMLGNPAAISPYVFNNFMKQDCDDEPVLGLNLQDYFTKRHLADQQPIEPLPPIENPLEMTQNNEDWVRHREDIKIEHEKYHKLQEFESFQNMTLTDKSESILIMNESEWDITNALGVSGKVRQLLDLDTVNISNSNDSVSQSEADRISGLDGCIQESELKQLLDLEQSLLKMLQNRSLSHFIVPTQSPPPEEDLESVEPMSQATLGGLKNLEHFLIKGDLRRCILCNSEYTDSDPVTGNGGNLPRVLYCGDCICETCIVKQIQKASITDKQNLNIAACQVTCPICCVKHIFKLTMQGFLICNDKYIKVQDDRGPVNFFPGQKSTNLIQGDFSQMFQSGQIQHMNQSISIPYSLVLRSLPINVELLQLIRKPNLDFSMLSEIPQQTPDSQIQNKRDFKIQQKSLISKASVPSPLEKRKEVQRKKALSSGSRKASQSFKSSQKSKKSLKKDQRQADSYNLFVKGDSMSSDSAHDSAPLQQNDLVLQHQANDSMYTTESEQDVEETKEAEQPKNLFDVMQGMINAIKKPGSLVNFSDIKIKQEGNFTTVNLTTKVSKKKKPTKKATPIKHQALQNLTKGVQITDDDLFTQCVPQNLEVFEVTETKSGRSTLQMKTSITDPFSVPDDQVQFEDKFHLLQTLKRNGKNSPVTCYQCSSSLPLRASKHFQLQYDFEESSDSPHIEVYQKPQHNLIKELIDIGVMSVCTHYCLHCYSNPLIVWVKQFNKDEDYSFMCLMCSIRHKRDMPEHFMQSLYTNSQIQATLKKSDVYQQLVKEELSQLIGNKVKDDLTAFYDQMFKTCEQVDKLANKKKKKK